MAVMALLQSLNDPLCRVKQSAIEALCLNAFKGHHFIGIVILWVVGPYCKFGISYRELQAEGQRSPGLSERIIGTTPGFKSMKTAYATIKGIEVMRALRKGRASAFYYGDPPGGLRLVNRAYGL